MSDEKIYGDDIGTFARFKLYSEMTDLGEIARRYFVMNFFDGVLTVLGFIVGSFILFLRGDSPTKLEVVVPAIATSIAIGISGISGGYLSERAERKRKIIEMHKAMGLHQERPDEENDDIKETFNEENYYPMKPIKKFEEKERNKTPDEHISVDPEPSTTTPPIKEQKKEKTLAEKAERFASLIASLINGVSPAIGGFVVVIPFLFNIPIPGLGLYITSFILIAVLLFLLGAYLAKISKDSIMKYGVKMTLVGILAASLAFLLSFLLPS